MSRSTPGRARWPLAALLAVAGVAHLLRADDFERLIPRWLPGTPTMWNQLTAAAELGSAALLARRRTVRAGGAAAFATLAVVWVANVQAALDGGYAGLPGWMGSAPAAWVRVPLQVPLLWWAAAVARPPPQTRRPSGRGPDGTDGDAHASTGGRVGTRDAERERRRR